MPVNRFWSSVGSVLAYLAGVGLLQYILGRTAGLFGLLPDVYATPFVMLVSMLVPIVGTMLYIDWRWSWKGEHIGLSRNPGAAAGKWALGLVAGAAGALLADVVSESIRWQGLTFSLPTVHAAFDPISLLQLAGSLILLFCAELVFRGAATSRLQADLSPQEVLIAAPLVPLLWFVVTQVFGYGYLPMGIQHTYDIAATLFVTLLFLRTDSVWLSAGLRMGFFAAVQLLALRVTTQGGMVVWGAGALILLAMEWNKLQRMPRRVQQRGRTTRGPWGPH